MNRRDVQTIIARDIEAAKAFLKTENNAERLNLNALVVIGVREGATMAVSWSASDWAFPSVGSVKQGQDVKALVFVSPESQFKGIAIEPLYSNRALMSLPLMVAAGTRGSQKDAAETMIRRIEVLKKRMHRGDVKDFTKLELPTPLSGPRLIKEAPPVVPKIVEFVTESLGQPSPRNAWVMRR